MSLADFDRHVEAFLSEGGKELNFSLLGPASVILIFWIIYGASENRFWKEHGEAWILGHFKTYHVLIGGLNLLLAWFGSGYASDLFSSVSFSSTLHLRLT